MTKRTPRIDVHAHMMEREAAAAGVQHSVVTAFGARQMPPAPPGSAQTGLCDLPAMPLASSHAQTGAEKRRRGKSCVSELQCGHIVDGFAVLRH